MKNNPAYKNYGGRGINVCDEWLGENGFDNFHKWAISNGWDESDSKNLTIDRIDVNGDYCPQNCRLVDMETQGNNKRNNIVLTYNGETMTLSRLCRKYNVDYKLAYSRYKKGWGVKDILFAPKYIVRKNGRRSFYEYI